LRRETIDLTGREIEYAAAIGDIALVSKTLANDERGFLISGAEEFRQQFDGRTAQAHEAFARAFANADAEQWDAVNRAQQSFDRWLAASMRDMDVYAAGNRDAAIEASLEETRGLRKEYEARLSGTQSLANFAIESASEDVSDTLGRAVTILMAYLFAALAVGIVIAIWLLRRLAQPLQQILADRQRPSSHRFARRFERRPEDLTGRGPRT
jgi:CHASE3 domain sensor protein